MEFSVSISLNLNDCGISRDQLPAILGEENYKDKVFKLSNNDDYIRFQQQTQATDASKDLLQPIRLISFQSFKDVGHFPRYPENKNICEDLDTIDRSTSLIVFISHCWLRGWLGAEGWDGQPHPEMLMVTSTNCVLEALKR